MRRKPDADFAYIRYRPVRRGVLRLPALQDVVYQQGNQPHPGECDGWYSVRQAVEVILNVERFRWQIYSPYSGMQWDGLIGQDPGYVASELQRRITEALKMDDRVRGSPALRMPWKGIC
ncbi:DUF2634 domain-containing protein [Flavonifractor plautii]|nr:DUF2634 domain-containing protein [Flavonifractor plautii]